ncbi:MAG: helix-turn-helix transcriptional regulator [Dehalococcoidia bacterium]
MRQGEWPLTIREARIAQLVVRGLSNSEIAEDLLVSGDTVKSHLKNVYRKCGVRNRAGLVRWWFEQLDRSVRSTVRSSAAHQTKVGQSVATRLLVALLLLTTLAVVGHGSSGLLATEAFVNVESLQVARTRWVDAPVDRSLGVGLGCASASSTARSGERCVAAEAGAQEFPTVGVVSPLDGGQVVGPTVEIQVEVTDFNLAPPSGTGATPGQGHIVYYLDFEPAFVPGQSAIPEDPDVAYAPTHLLAHTFGMVAPGPHQVFVLLVHGDHTPIIPPTIHSVNFTVLPPGETAVPPPDQPQTEVGRTVAVDKTPVAGEAPDSAVLPAVLPVVGEHSDEGRIWSTESWWLVAGVAFLAGSGLVALAFRYGRHRH